MNNPNQAPKAAEALKSVNLEEVGEKVLHMANSVVDNVKEQVSSYAKEGREKMEALSERIEEQFEQHTLRTVLIGAGVAAGIVGLLAWLKSR